jgi:hypothetical protein
MLTGCMETWEATGASFLVSRRKLFEGPDASGPSHFEIGPDRVSADPLDG